MRGSTVKRCPHCAEEIQDAALVCKHCGRKVGTANSFGAAPRQTVLIALGVILLVVMVYGVLSFKQNSEREMAMESKALEDSAHAADKAKARVDSIRRAAIPRFYEITDEDALEVPAGGSRQFRFERANGNCKVIGNVRGLDGGNKDVEVFLFSRAQFVDWKAAPEKATAEATLPKDTSHILDVQLYGTGDTYYLVVSNTFSTFTAKTVQVKARLRCDNTEPPVIRE